MVDCNGLKRRIFETRPSFSHLHENGKPAERNRQKVQNGNLAAKFLLLHFHKQFIVSANMETWPPSFDFALLQVVHFFFKYGNLACRIPLMIENKRAPPFFNFKAFLQKPNCQIARKLVQSRPSHQTELPSRSARKVAPHQQISNTVGTPKVTHRDTKRKQEAECQKTARMLMKVHQTQVPNAQGLILGRIPPRFPLAVRTAYNLASRQPESGPQGTRHMRPLVASSNRVAPHLNRGRGGGAPRSPPPILEAWGSDCPRTGAPSPSEPPLCHTSAGSG